MLPIQWKKLFAIVLAVALLDLYVFVGYPIGSGFLYANHLKSVTQTTSKLPKYGIASGSYLTSMSSAQLDAYFAQENTLGVSWVRFDFDWSNIQPDSAGTYNWGPYDQIVASATAHHLYVLGIIDFTPGWAAAPSCQSGKQCPPQNPATYAKFASTLASRYKSDGLHYWEIWNEENTQTFWQPAPDVKAYSALLKAASSAIHGADSLAIVISGGLAPAQDTDTTTSPATFLTGIYKYAGRDAFDAVGVHPYTFPVPPDYSIDTAWIKMSQGPNNLRSIMAANSDSAKKIWITEFGAPTNGSGPAADIGNLDLVDQPYHVTEALQASEMSTALSLYKTYDWVGPIFLYTLQDNGNDPTNNEDWFGLLRSDGSQKPAYTAVSQAIK